MLSKVLCNPKSTEKSGLHPLFGITPPQTSGLHHPNFRDYTTISFGITLLHNQSKIMRKVL